jgi:hypothetical protein
MERKHRHILQVARALRFHAQLPSNFGVNVSLLLSTSSIDSLLLSSLSKLFLNFSIQNNLLFLTSESLDV